MEARDSERETMTSFDLGTMIDDILSTPARLQAERDLRLAAEDRARVAEERAAELSRALDAALADRWYYHEAYIAQANEIAAMTTELNRPCP